MWWYYLQLQQYSFLYLFIVIFYVNSLSVRLVGVSGSERPEVLFICHRGADKKGSALFMQTPAAGKKHSLPHLSPNMCILDSFPIYLLLTTTALFPKSRLRRWADLNTLFAVSKTQILRQNSQFQLHFVFLSGRCFILYVAVYVLDVKLKAKKLDGLMSAQEPI